jgi:hypothetical protein
MAITSPPMAVRRVDEHIAIAWRSLSAYMFPWGCGLCAAIAASMSADDRDGGVLNLSAAGVQAMLVLPVVASIIAALWVVRARQNAADHRGSIEVTGGGVGGVPGVPGAPVSSQIELDAYSDALLGLNGGRRKSVRLGPWSGVEDPRRLRMLCDSLKYSTLLEELAFENVPIGDEGARILAHALVVHRQSLSRLRRIRARGTGITSDGAKALVDAISVSAPSAGLGGGAAGGWGTTKDGMEPQVPRCSLTIDGVSF